MKRSPFITTLLLVLFLVPYSCKKYVQQQEENALVKIVTQGQWSITNFLDHDTLNITSSFSGYAFQFNPNYTLYGTKFGQQTNGTWSADIGNKTITTNFPGASYPINMLNHTWTITDSYTDSVAAKTPVDSSYNILNLHKN